MALGSYRLSHQRQSYYYHLADTSIYIQGLDFQSTLGNPTLATSIEAITINGLDFESTLGNLNIRTNIQINGLDFLSTIGNLGVTETWSMAYIGHDASSLFISKNQSTNPSSVVKRFTYNNSDFSGRVTKYGNISREYSKVVGKAFTIDMENASGLMNDLNQNRANLRKTGDVMYGYQTTPSSADVISIGTGKLTNVSYDNKNGAKLTFKTRLDTLAQDKVSIDTTSRQGANFTTSNHNPADLLFHIMTASSYGGGYSSIASYTNPVINYDSWKAWKDQLTSESITVRGFIPHGTNYQKTIQALAEITDSAIYVEADNRLFFARYLTGSNSFTAVASENDIISMTATVNAYDMCNQYSVPMSYSVTSNRLSDSPSGTVTIVNTSSINSFGTISKEPVSKLFWYTSSANAVALANRVTVRRREPEVAVKITTPIKYLNQQLTDIMRINVSELGLVDQPYTIIGETINLEQDTIIFDLSVGHGIAIANITVFELNDDVLGRLNNTVGVLA